MFEGNTFLGYEIKNDHTLNPTSNLHTIYEGIVLMEMPKVC